MPQYVVWYKKSIEAKNIKEAITKEMKVKPQFHSLVEERPEPEEIQVGTSAIGFMSYENENED